MYPNKILDHFNKPKRGSKRCTIFDCYIKNVLVSWCVLPINHEGNHEVSVSSEILSDVVAVIKRLGRQS